MAFLTAAEALKWALEIEKNGEAFYREVAAKGVDPEVKALFEDLACLADPAECAMIPMDVLGVEE